MTRSESKQDLVRGLGARPVVADALDAEAVSRVVAEAEPEAILHELTSIPGDLEPRHFDRDFAPTNRLRTEGTEHLLAAARTAGARRFVAQSYAGWPYARTGGRSRPRTTARPRSTGTVSPHVGHDPTARGGGPGADWIEGLVLRYGAFYGPGTSIGAQPEGEQVAAVRKRRFPVVGSGDGIWSFVQIEDAATATAAAVNSGRAGIYNVVDDDPAPVSEWLPALAAAVGAKSPRRVPRGWPPGGREAAVAMMTEQRGASNAKAKRELGWEPRYPSWRDGFDAAWASRRAAGEPPACGSP
jgi:nucleoside-diphosphate-sugar epimerase